jgi:hypothetical protein
MMDWMLSAQNDVARLPALVWQQGWMSAGWSVVLAWLGAWSASRWSTRQDVKAAVAIGLAVWVWLPGPWGGAFWLGLAFQAPSVTTVLLCAFLGGRMLLFPVLPYKVRQMWSSHVLFLALCGVALGWGLLLDTLGVWSGSFYNWGFGAAAPAIAFGIAALPWVIAKKAFPHQGVVVIAIATLFFAILRLPTGNLFDALIDPWLWCSLQFALIQQWRHRSKRVST